MVAESQESEGDEQRILKISGNDSFQETFLLRGKMVLNAIQLVYLLIHLLHLYPTFPSGVLGSILVLVLPIFPHHNNPQRERRWVAQSLLLLRLSLVSLLLIQDFNHLPFPRLQTWDIIARLRLFNAGHHFFLSHDPLLEPLPQSLGLLLFCFFGSFLNYR